MIDRNDEAIDFRKFTATELRTICNAMEEKPSNPICVDFGNECQQQLAACEGKLVFLRESATTVDFTTFNPADLIEASAVFRNLAKKFKASNGRVAKRFCEVIIVRCRGGLEAKEDRP